MQSVVSGAFLARRRGSKGVCMTATNDFLSAHETIGTAIINPFTKGNCNNAVGVLSLCSQSPGLIYARLENPEIILGI